jgi:hypothetical protein
VFRDSALNFFHWSSQTPNESRQEYPMSLLRDIPHTTDAVNENQNIIAVLLLKEPGLTE